MVCAGLPAVPKIEPLTAFVAGDGIIAYNKPQVDERDVTIARWIVDVRGAWFSCSNQLERVRDYYAEQD